MQITATLAALPAGKEGVRATLAHMARFALAGAKSWAVRRVAMAQVVHLRARDHGAEVAALLAFVQRGIRYLRDPVNAEWIQDPARTLALKQGDCDDKSTLLAALLLSIGHPARFVAVGFRPGVFSHVYVETRLAGRWVALETVKVGAPVGWAPPGIVERMPVDVGGGQLAGLGWGLSVKSISKAFGKAQKWVNKNVITTIDRNSKYLALVPGPVGAAAMAYTAVKGAQAAYRTHEEQKKAEQQAKRAEAQVRAKLKAAGYSAAQSNAVIARLNRGETIEAALGAVGVPANQQKQNEGELMATPQAARGAFLNWVKTWNPKLHAALVARGLGDLYGAIDHDTGEYAPGLGDWADSVASFVTQASNAAKSVLTAVNDQKMFDMQLKRMQAQRAPLPTPVARTAAAQAQPSGMPGWVKPVAIGTGAAALLFLGVRAMRA